MKKILIFGRSPFINKIDFNKIDYRQYDVLCINNLVPQCKTVNYMVSVDEPVKFLETKNCEWVSINTGWEFKNEGYIIKEKCLCWRHFSSSAAVSFAILRGYKEILLAGIDLIGGTFFKHYDGSMTSKIMSFQICNEEREFIKEICQKNSVEIFTLNKENDWLQFKDIGVIKHGSKEN